MLRSVTGGPSAPPPARAQPRRVTLNGGETSEISEEGFDGFGRPLPNRGLKNSLSLGPGHLPRRESEGSVFDGFGRPLQPRRAVSTQSVEKMKQTDGTISPRRVSAFSSRPSANRQPSPRSRSATSSSESPHHTPPVSPRRYMTLFASFSLWLF